MKQLRFSEYFCTFKVCKFPEVCCKHKRVPAYISKKSVVLITLLKYEAQHSHPPPSAQASVGFPCGHPIRAFSIPSLPLAPPTLHPLSPTLIPDPPNSWHRCLWSSPCCCCCCCSLCIAHPLYRSFCLPVDRSSGKRTRRLLCLVHTWFYSSPLCVYEHWKGSPGLSCI